MLGMYNVHVYFFTFDHLESKLALQMKGGLRQLAHFCATSHGRYLPNFIV